MLTVRCKLCRAYDKFLLALFNQSRSVVNIFLTCGCPLKGALIILIYLVVFLISFRNLKSVDNKRANCIGIPTSGKWYTL
jgi:hypothetical protein